MQAIKSHLYNHGEKPNLFSRLGQAGMTVPLLLGKLTGRRSQSLSHNVWDHTRSSVLMDNTHYSSSIQTEIVTGQTHISIHVISNSNM